MLFNNDFRPEMLRSRKYLKCHASNFRNANLLKNKRTKNILRIKIL